MDISEEGRQNGSTTGQMGTRNIIDISSDESSSIHKHTIIKLLDEEEREKEPGNKERDKDGERKAEEKEQECIRIVNSEEEDERMDPGILTHLTIYAAAIYLSIQIIIVLVLNMYFYYELKSYMACGFVISFLLALAKSLTPFISLKIASVLTKDVVFQFWMYLRNVFYVTLGFIVLGTLVMMFVMCAAELSLLTNAIFVIVFFIVAIDFVVFLLVGIFGICLCNKIIAPAQDARIVKVSIRMPKFRDRELF
jgi:hypothetical protein